MTALRLFKTNLTRQTRSFAFILIVSLSIFAGFLCVPSAADGYQVFYLNGIRGIYNSAWLGALSALLPAILLWLPGFYLLRSQVSEDKRLNIGKVIASTPISKLKYLAGKTFSNFMVLMVLQLLFTVALMAMQLIRHESMAIQLGQYALPLLLISIPSLFVLASLTVLFDVVPFLKGTFGNILIFILWTGLSSVSVASPNNPFDLFGIGMIINAMGQGAKAVFPSLPADTGSFGYYKIAADAPTFEWGGLIWDSSFVATRLAMVGAGLVLIAIAALVFDRFKETQSRSPEVKRKKGVLAQTKFTLADAPRSLSKVERGNGIVRMTLGEMKIMLAGRSLWWYLCVVGSAVLTVMATAQTELKWLACFTLFILPLWSSFGCREKMYFTSDIVYSSCSKMTKWLTGWAAGILVSAAFSAGFIVRFVRAGDYSHLSAWLVGILFLCTLAQTLGSISGNRRFFEAIFVPLFYFGPFSGMEFLDFFGVYSNQAATYLIITAVLFAVGVTNSIRREKR